MGKRKFSNLDLEKLVNQGMGVRQIARKLKVSPASVSERLKNLRVAVSKNLAVRNAGKLVKKKFDAMDQLLNISRIVNKELDFIREKIKENPDDRGKWQEIQLKHTAEVRHQIKLMLDIAQVLYRAEEVAAFQQTVLEEIGNADPEVRERILKRLTERGTLARSTRFDLD